MTKVRVPSSTVPGARPRPKARPSHSRSRASRATKPLDHRKMHEATWSRADAIAFLESPERRASQDPRLLWRRVGLHAGEIVLDVGAGSGYFSFPAAEVVGPNGRVYAVDLSNELLELVRERAEAAKVRNVETVLSTPARIPLEDGVADVALLANVLHGISPKTVVETIRVLHPGGRLVDVDWKKKGTPEGPPVDHRLSVREATAALSAYGLQRIDSFELGPYHYVLVFARPRPHRLPGHLVSAE